jgi:4-hydroxy-tetrahydrodipicolinate reductase
MRIGVAGINGRMGRLLVPAIQASPADLVGGIARAEPHAATPLFTDIAALAAECDVVIDFTHSACVIPHAAALADAGTAWVLGTTGLDDASQHAVAQAASRIGIVQAANFSPGLTLLMGLAQRLGAALPADTYDAEILEMHHRQKADAPSGTALALGHAVAAGRATTLAAVARTSREGQTGPRPAGEIGFASLRGGQIIGEHTLSFTSAGEQITLAHRAFDRGIFAAGAVRAALWLHGQPPGLYGMPDVLGL